MLARTTHVSLLARLADGQDNEAWREFSDRYGALLRGFARARGLSACDCDDVVQDVIAALVRHMPNFRYDPSKGRFRGYLKTIAVREIQRRLGADGQATPISDVEAFAADDPEQEAVWELEWRQYHMRLAMRSIDAEFNAVDRLAFQRYGVEGLGARETAEALGLSLDQVYQAKSRILRRLGELIEAQIEDEG